MSEQHDTMQLSYLTFALKHPMNIFLNSFAQLLAEAHAYCGVLLWMLIGVLLGMLLVGDGDHRILLRTSDFDDPSLEALARFRRAVGEHLRVRAQLSVGLQNCRRKLHRCQLRTSATRIQSNVLRVKTKARLLSCPSTLPNSEVRSRRRSLPSGFSQSLRLLSGS